MKEHQINGHAVDVAAQTPDGRLVSFNAMVTSSIEHEIACARAVLQEPNVKTHFIVCATKALTLAVAKKLKGITDLCRVRVVQFAKLESELLRGEKE